jgi:biopolymer transport protein ExbB
VIGFAFTPRCSLAIVPSLIEMSSSSPNPRTLALLCLAGCSFTAQPSAMQGPGDAPIGGSGDAAIDSPSAPDGPRTSWWNPDWRHRRLITIDTSKLSPTLTGYPLTGFPVLIKLTPQTIDYTAVKSDGSDLRFVLPDQATVLDYDIDTFALGGTSLIWVRIPTLARRTAQQLFVYYGNPGAPGATSGLTVFADTHVSVHHMGTDYNDVTGHGHTGIATGNPAAIADSPLGGARRFNGTSDYVTLNGQNSYNFATALTVSVWIRVTAFDVVYQAIVTKGDTAWRIHRENTTRHLGFGTTSGGNNDNQEGTITVDDNQWHHAAIVYDGAKKAIYVDGAQDATETYTLAIAKNNVSVAIGRNSESMAGGDRLWHGDIDEVRISGIARAPAWIGAEYVTATDPTFVTIGPDERY